MPRRAARAFAGAQRAPGAARAAAGIGYRWSTRCARSGKTPPSTTARPPRAACATALSRALETYALQAGRPVTTICEGLRRDIVSRGIADERITVIPNAVDTATNVCALAIPTCGRGNPAFSTFYDPLVTPERSRGTNAVTRRGR